MSWNGCFFMVDGPSKVKICLLVFLKSLFSRGERIEQFFFHVRGSNGFLQIQVALFLVIILQIIEFKRVGVFFVTFVMDYFLRALHHGNTGAREG